MRGERYVALGVAPPRAAWFTELARWSTSAAVPLEFVKCVTVEEVRARLASGRAFSAVLVDSSLPFVDRDLVDDARAVGCAVIAVDDGRLQRDWSALGMSAVISSEMTRGDLLDVLETHAVPIGRGDVVTALNGATATAHGWRGRLVAVTGPGGTGASTISIAIAQGLAADVRHGGLVLLADLALEADHAMLHDASSSTPTATANRRRQRSGHSRSSRPTAATACCSGSAVTVTGRRSGPARSKQPSTACGARTRS
jgi:hypothetical protein